mmetsp:Transcript_34921/g.84516  ORF Transcript_34921/g.84516 Transcript_34921/m.84516 type:complete len:251 (-) Transcript_34921:1758-2510(-)
MGMTFQPILSQSVTAGLIIQVFESISQVFHWSLAHGKAIDKVLVVNTHSQSGISLDISLGGIDFTRQKFQQGRFTSTIGSNHTNSAVHIDTKINLIENDRVFWRISEMHIVDFHNWSTNFRHVREFKLDSVFLGSLDKFSFFSGLSSSSNGLVLLLLTSGTGFTLGVLLDCFLGLGLTLSGTLEFSQPLLLLFPSLDLLLQTFLLGLFETIVVTLVGNELEVFNVKDFLAHTVQEILIVGNNKKCLLPGL